MAVPFYVRIAAGPMTAVVCVRIVVLQIDSGIWCATCHAPSTMTVTYVVEERDWPPQSVHQLTYCEACEDR